MEDLWPGGTGYIVLLDFQKAAVESLKVERNPWSDPRWDHVYSQTGPCHPCVQMAKMSAEEMEWLCIGQK